MKKPVQDVKQRRPFDSHQAEAISSIERTANQMRLGLQKLLREHGLTASQYNALRILRGAEPLGLSCSDLGRQMVSHDPDVTRLLSRLSRMRLVEQRRDVRDRRVVLARITSAGLLCLRALDPIVKRGAHKSLGHMDHAKLALLVELLEEARGGRAASRAHIAEAPASTNPEPA
ncbi:MAG TPA: MarR family transcriptional regulator [Acidisarcina sp.]